MVMTIVKVNYTASVESIILIFSFSFTIRTSDNKSLKVHGCDGSWLMATCES
jgi:hypothetical protein